ncbi:sensor histidine kinase [Streptomyces sp. AN091965]|uniref:sensor histidine kinase n=1 Tax=Streptomyces sp. AN091965 TaxID=2927803 RepID=UPI001F618E0D|nr:sensor domain-containing protein [Streptomyces sp. AN091965]MCI3933580.1 sensor domain-containing protein [Streptomyces sp. AN091965]
MRHHPPHRFLLSSWPLRCWAYVCGGVPLGLAVLLVMLVLVAGGLLTSAVGIGLVLLTAAALSGIPLGRLERRRLRLVEPTPLRDPHRPLKGAGLRARLRTRCGERATWRELGYAWLLALVFSAAGLGVALLLLFALVLVTCPVIVWALAPDTVMIIPGQAVPHPPAGLPFTAAGLLFLALAAYAAGLLAGVQTRTAHFLLAPREEPLTRHVVELTRSRARLVDAFEAERRRIERDLHDGAQQQLVALTMTLGLAEMELGDGNPAAAALLARGRGEARHALDQLRDLVRGIHPQVLTDHGLAAAVTEVALRHPIPVTVDIDLPHRLPDAVETTAYFTITEALTNAAKHSGATEVQVRGRLRKERLTLTITDNGRGDADPARGTGLTGLADRLAILRGRLTVSSPVGGPTRLTVEVPCSA